MINIDDAIIQALIGAVIPAICTVLSWFVSAFHFQHDKDRELFESQLSDLYEPLVGIIIRYHHELTDEEIHEITKLMCDHNSKAPPMLLDAWESVLKSGITSWPHFNSVLQSNYNWVKKRLGYPYSAEQIKDEYHPYGYIETKTIGQFAIVFMLVLPLTFTILESFTEIGMVKAGYGAIRVITYLFGCYFLTEYMNRKQRERSRKKSRKIRIQKARH